MEELLNKLIEKGWKPFGRTPKKHWWIYCMETDMFEFWIKFYVDDLNWIWEFVSYEMPIRNVTSKESWLWQFCMTKWFTPNVSCYSWEKWFYNIDDQTQCEADVSWLDDYQYRLIESALCDEDKLEEFLLDNIKIWDYES